MHRLAKLSAGSLRLEILLTVFMMLCTPTLVKNWAAGVQEPYANLGMAFPFTGGIIQNIYAYDFQQSTPACQKSVWSGLHLSPRNAPSACAKLCMRTCLRWVPMP